MFYYCIYSLYPYALQLLSEQVANGLDYTKKDDITETAKFVRYIDKFFDCFNVSNWNTGYHKRKRFRDPYICQK